MKRKLSILLITILITSLSAAAQKYDRAIGLRAGSSFTVTYKHGLKKGYIEGILGSHHLGGGFRAAALYELHFKLDQSLFPTDELYWYIGGGVFFSNFRDENHGGSHNHSSPGIAGVIGLDYTLDSYPIN